MNSQEQTTIITPAELGAVLRDRRRSLGLTLQEASDHIGLGIRFISEVERGKGTAEIGKVMKLCAMLGIDLFARTR